MSHYKHNLRDLEFTLFEVLGRDQVLGTGPFEDVDGETARDMLAEVARLATEDLAPSLLDSDRNPPVFDPAMHSVRLPESFRRSYQAYVDAEFWRADVPVELGGTPIPPACAGPSPSSSSAATPAAHVQLGLLLRQGRAHAGHRGPEAPGRPHGGERLGRARWCSPSPTPARTSAPAGPRRSQQRRRHLAHRRASSASSRPASTTWPTTSSTSCWPAPRAPAPGTKGLSLFVVPKFHVDLETGELGERNGVFATNVEHKMGLKVSTTCELTFGEVDGIPAVGTPARRRPRRHRADVPDHRVRPDDGRHQGDRDPVHRLPQRPRVRQGRASRAPTSRRWPTRRRRA